MQPLIPKAKKKQTMLTTIFLVSVFWVPGNVFAGLPEDLQLVKETCTSPYSALAQRGRALLQTLYEAYGAKPEINRTISFCGIKKFERARSTRDGTAWISQNNGSGGVRSMEPQLPEQSLRP